MSKSQVWIYIKNRIFRSKMGLEDYKDLISTCATITTIAQFLTGITVCQKYIKNGTTGESSSAPFVRYYQYNKIIYFTKNKIVIK